jgi:hypothetical protein
MARRLSLSEIAKRAEKLAHYGTDSDRSTYALRGVDRPLGKRRVKKHDTEENPEHSHDPTQAPHPTRAAPKPTGGNLHSALEAAGLPVSTKYERDPQEKYRVRQKPGKATRRDGLYVTKWAEGEYKLQLHQTVYDGERYARLLSRATQALRDAGFNVTEDARWGIIVRRGSGTVAKQFKVYLKPGEKPPQGVHVQEGPRGGLYYESVHDPSAGEPEPQERVFGGKPVALAHKPSKLETGEIGEKIALQLLLDQGFGDARRLSVEEAQNFPVDVMADHHVVEVKAGLVSNGESAQHWRATIGQPGPTEAAWLKAAAPEEKAAWNRVKGKATIERKQQVLMAIGRERGIRLKAKTYGIILNTDTRQADVYVIDGFHERVGWKSELAQHSYVGTVSF